MKSKKNLLIGITLFIFSNCAFAMVMPGFTMGVQVGEGITHYETDDVSGVTSADIDDKGLAGRIFLGYQATDIWGFELGYTRFADTDFNNINGTGLNGDITEQAIDLVAKGTYTLPNNSLGLYGKVGVGYVDAEAEDGLTGDNDALMPVFGLGLSYSVTPTIPVDISWTRFQDTGSDIPSADLIALGIAYNFG